MTVIFQREIINSHIGVYAANRLAKQGDVITVEQEYLLVQILISIVVGINGSKGGFKAVSRTPLHGTVHQITLGFAVDTTVTGTAWIIIAFVVLEPTAHPEVIYAVIQFLITGVQENTHSIVSKLVDIGNVSFRRNIVSR